jgi:predicted TIM-barrel fold metal-dependent hydrolase
MIVSCEPGEKTLPYVVSAVGDQCIMYASGYPHPDSKWPNTVAPIQKADISAVAKKRILEENAAQLYGLGDAWRGGTEAAMCELVRCNQLV